VVDLGLDLSLVGLVLRQPAKDRGQLLRRLRAVADHRARLRASRDDLLVQRDLLGLELVRGGLQLRLLLGVGLRLPLELRLLRLQASLLLLELLLLLGQLLALRVERVCLRRQLLLLALPLLLLLLELLLQRLGLLLLARVLAARLRRRSQLDSHQERAVVAGPEALGHQVVRLALRRRLRRRAYVLLAEVQGEEGNDQQDQECEHGGDRPPGMPRHRPAIAPHEAGFRPLGPWPEERGQAA
jgi:hypothetical protein